MMLATCSRTAASSVMSSGVTSALPPLRLMARAVTSSSFTVRPAHSTVAPAAPRVMRHVAAQPARGAGQQHHAVLHRKQIGHAPVRVLPVLPWGPILAYEGRQEISGGTHGEIGQGGDRDGLGDGARRLVRDRPGGARLERRHQLHQEQEGSRRDLRDGQGQGRRGDPGAGRHGPGRRLPEARRRDPEEVGPHRRPHKQRRHHQVPEPGRPRRRHAGGLRPHPARQRHRPLHDEPRRLPDHEEAVGGQAGARRRSSTSRRSRASWASAARSPMPAPRARSTR